MNMDDYNIVKAFDVIERELIASMLRNMDRHKAEESDRGIEWTTCRRINAARRTAGFM